jgi:transcription elongation factor Elf1
VCHSRRRRRRKKKTLKVFLITRLRCVYCGHYLTLLNSPLKKKKNFFSFGCLFGSFGCQRKKNVSNKRGTTYNSKKIVVFT